MLLVAVQSKSNEKVISDIMSLDYEGQRDLMFFIETTLAKVKSHAIIAGTFTSGKKRDTPGPAVNTRQSAHRENILSCSSIATINFTKVGVTS